ncbi:MAG: GNAT family N-acetyltransferase [Pseudomonadota bacterium]
MVLRSAGPEAEILTLAVAPDARRQGIARALLALGETQARARGVAEMFLEVAQDNHPALALYRGTGYREAGVRKDYYQGPRGARVSALVLKKAL